MASILRVRQSPGVELREFDKSQYSPGIQGSYALVTGFSNSGPNEQPIVGISDIDTKNQIFGEPTNEAERYFHYGCEEVIRNGGTLVAARIPYESANFENKINASSIKVGVSESTSGSIILDAIKASEFFDTFSSVSVDHNLQIGMDDYESFANGQDFPAAHLDKDFMLVNKTREVFNEEREGLIVLVVDPIDAMIAQMVFNSSSDSDYSTIVTSIDGIDQRDLVVKLSAKLREVSISEHAAKQFPTMDFTDNGTSIDKSFANHIGIVVAKVYKDDTQQGFYNVGIVESFVGSIHKESKNPSTGQTDYIINVVNANSIYFEMYGNPRNYVPQVESIIRGLTMETVLHVNQVENLPIIGFDITNQPKNIKYSTIAKSLDNIFEKLSNVDDIQLDYVVDSGLSTIAQFVGDIDPLYYGVYAYDLSNYSVSTHGSIENYINTENPELKDSIEFNPGFYNRSLDQDATALWRSICNKLIGFCQDIRKDCWTILDVPRNLVIDGNRPIIRESKPENTFSTSISPYLRYISGLNSSYAALYSNWVKVVDNYTGTPFWLSQSVKIAGINVKNDITGNEFDAPAGLNYGRLTGVVELSINPKTKDADQLYMKSLNYAKFYSVDGFVVEGQKTTQTKPSAFDRINVRKLFLRVEREFYNISRYMVYEPNNFFTRRRFVDLCNPTLKRLMQLGRIYDYRIVCDERNNTPDVIERNEMKLAVFIKPTKTAEFILLDFYATSTTTNMNELVQDTLI